MRISVFGLGYVGAVTAACLARDGNHVTGVDVNAEKVELVASGASPIVEEGLDVLLARAVADGRLRATTDAGEAVAATELSVIAVGTPPLANGEPDLGYVMRVCEEIADAVQMAGRPHVVVLRSTVPPGTLARCAEVFAAKDVEVHLAFNPEFLREGSAIRDYDTPAYTIVGTTDPAAEQKVRALYASVCAPVLVVEPSVAEMVKYVANAWHATKIVFANEVGRLAKACGVDGRDVMDVIAQDTKLNVSPAYMRPGFAYGGSCLPKDVGALLSQARRYDVPVPLLSSVPLSNAQQIDLAFDAVMAARPRRVTVLGLAFKPNTDDLRESPAVPLVKRLLGEGCEVRIFDRDVNHAHLMGTNLAYIRGSLPHFEALLAGSAADAVAWADAVVVTYGSGDFVEALTAGDGKHVVDLAGLFRGQTYGWDAHGIAW
jgi:GDP-mannose 6-dehydrogenase